jgi:hypothetical protein
MLAPLVTMPAVEAVAAERTTGIGSGAAAGHVARTARRAGLLGRYG